jgi:hypothetical protein
VVFSKSNLSASYSAIVQDTPVVGGMKSFKTRPKKAEGLASEMGNQQVQL